MDVATDINRLKVILAEKKRINKWLCEKLNVNSSTGYHSLYGKQKDF